MTHAPRFVIGAAIAVITVSGSASLPAEQSSAVFRSTVAAVVVAVRVTDGNRPVLGLTAADFQLLDNGVAQDVALSAVESLPVDVTLVLDTSGSLKGPALDRLKSGVQDIAESLRLNDQVRLVTFAHDVTDLVGLQPGGVRLPVDRIEGGGGTSFYNALAAALISFPQTDRPQLIFGFSDGLDTMSFLGANHVVTLAGYSSASLYLALVREGAMASIGMTPYEGGPNFDRLREAVARTGGALYIRSPDTALATLFREVLDDFRTSYILTYAPRGVAREGWHEIAVRTGNRGHTVRARTGYTGG